MMFNGKNLTLAEIVEDSWGEYAESGKYDVYEPLWDICSTGHPCPNSDEPEYSCEDHKLVGDLLHLKFRVSFVESTVGGCPDMPSLDSRSGFVYITRDLRTGDFETYCSNNTGIEGCASPDWESLFGEEPPSYEDSFT